MFIYLIKVTFSFIFISVLYIEMTPFFHLELSLLIFVLVQICHVFKNVCACT